MSEYANFIETLTQKRQGSCGILSEIVCRKIHELDACIAPSAVVITQGCNALTSQSVSYYGKWLMLEQFLVAVLLSAACHHEHHRSVLRVVLWQGKCAVKGISCIGETYAFLFVGEWWYRRLWTLYGKFACFQSQWQRISVLCEGSLYLSVSHLSFKRSSNHFNRHLYRAVVCNGFLSRNALCVL